MFDINKPWIILLCGLASSGKDTIIEYLTDKPCNYINFDENKWLRIIYTIVKNGTLSNLGRAFNDGTLSNILSDNSYTDFFLESYDELRSSGEFDRHEIIGLAEFFRSFDPDFWPKLAATQTMIETHKTYCGSIVGDRSLQFYTNNFNVFSVNLICYSSDLDTQRQKDKDSRNHLTFRNLDVKYTLAGSKASLTSEISEFIYFEFSKHCEMLRNPKTIEFYKYE